MSKRDLIKDLTKQLKKDRGLYYAWQSNIAMAMSDAYYNYKKKFKKETVNKEDMQKIVNEAAKNFLNSLIR